MSGAQTELVEVRIEQLPLELYREASEHNDELLREFALIRDRDPDESRSVPRRLLTLVAELGERFSGFSGEQTSQLQAALERGDRSIDLRYRVPAEARRASIDLGAMLDEADAFCREGKELLTLTTPPAALAFRRWFLAEFVRQLDGEPPLPWPEYSRRAGVAVQSGS